jgi:2-methylaconitate cis-trans-isomerase PrpF
VDVRILNTNTGRIIVETMEVDEDGQFIEDGDSLLPGTRSTGSRIDVAFEKPAGSMTGHMLPSGQPTDVLHIPGTIVRPSCDLRVSLVDAANPFVLVDSSTVPESILSSGTDSTYFLDFIETVRCHGAVRMGLAVDLEAAGKTRGTPKIAMLSTPSLAIDNPRDLPDLEVAAFSMGKVHGSLQLTGAVCIASAVCTPGTIAHNIAKTVDQYRMATGSAVLSRRDSGTDGTIISRQVDIIHPSGRISAEVRSNDGDVESVKLWRTARRLFEGNVCFVA